MRHLRLSVWQAPRRHFYLWQLAHYFIIFSKMSNLAMSPEELNVPGGVGFITVNDLVETAAEGMSVSWYGNMKLKLLY